MVKWRKFMTYTIKPKISAAIAVYNEESNIKHCINSLKVFADEIVVVDGNSTDQTARISKDLGAKVINSANKKMFNINKNLAIKNCSGDWIFLIDADERVSPGLAKEILTTVAGNPAENGFSANRRNWFLGGFLTKGGAYPDSVVRLFKKGKGILPEKNVHEQIAITGEIGSLKQDLIHFADPSFSRYLHRAQRYSDISAPEIGKENLENNVSSLLIYTVFKPMTLFMTIYFRHLGFLDGFRGFVWALFSSAHYFFAYVKYFKNPLKSNEHY